MYVPLHARKGLYEELAARLRSMSSSPFVWLLVIVFIANLAAVTR